MTYLHQLYGLNPGDSRYRSKLKSRIQNIFPSELIFVKVKTNIAEIVLSKTVFDNIIHYSIDKDSSINEVASIIKLDIVSYCKTLPEMSWPPKIEEIERIEMPESMRIFLTKLMSGKEHATVNNENVKRLVNSFRSDIINAMMKGRILTKEHYLLSLHLHSMIGTRTIITILNKLGHCLNYNKTCEIETAIAESNFIRAKEKNILPILAVEDEIILTFFSTDNFDVNIESEKGGGSIHTTHLMAFRLAIG